MMAEKGVGTAALVLCCLFASQSLGQTASETRDESRVARTQRYTGFVPGHLKVKNEDLPDRSNELQAIRIARSQRSAKRSREELVVSENVKAEPKAGNAATEESTIEDWLAVEEGSDGPPSGRMIPEGDYNTHWIWGRADYLRWWTKGMDTPALATTSESGTPQNQAGVLGQEGTSTLFGGAGLNDESRSGGRFSLGMWIDPCETKGLDVTYLFLDDESEFFVANTGDFSILARPFFNTVTEQQDSRLIQFPGLVEGSLSIDAVTDFETLEALFRQVVLRHPTARGEYFVGYRYARLEDGIRIGEFTQSLSGPTQGATFNLFDQFETENTFNGPEFGMSLVRHCWSCVSLEVSAKVALGNTRSRAVVSGGTLLSTSSAGSTSTPAGLLAQGTNIGTFEQDEFGAISEINVTLQRPLSYGFKALLGYSFLHWNDVLRAGDQIDPEINTTQIPPGSLDGQPSPSFPFATSDFWAQGLHVGLERRF